MKYQIIRAGTNAAITMQHYRHVSFYLYLYYDCQTNSLLFVFIEGVLITSLFQFA